MKIPFNVLDRTFFMHQEAYEQKALEVMRKGWYILGSEVEAFETAFAQYIGVPHCVGLANGLDALILAFRALGIGQGDEVIVAANSYIACVMGITINGAKPIFVEPNGYYNIDPEAVRRAISPKTKAVLAVHLYGQACDMTALKDLCDAHALFLVEDCAQSHGARHGGQMTGTFGHISCFSFYPSKNLGAFGDAGAVVTHDAACAARIRRLRNYGSEKRYHNAEVGLNSRLDELQAGLLNVKLAFLEDLNAERMALAKRYMTEITHPQVVCPKIQEPSTHIFHLFVVEVPWRDDFIAYLKACGIDTVIHYPIPPHLSEAYAYLGYKAGDFPVTEAYAQSLVSLPLYNGMTHEEITYVIDNINAYKR